MADILGDVAAGAESPLEMKYLHDVERPHGLPPGNRQQRRYGLPYLSDVGYDEFRVLVELDGYRPCVVAFQIASALVARDWNGVPTRCPRCLNVPEMEVLGCSCAFEG
jgi:hypothetical protein